MQQLIIQLLYGSAIISLGIGVQVVFMVIAFRAQPLLKRLVRQRTMLTRMALLSGVTLWTLGGQGIGVWLWAAALYALGAVEGFEPSLYFSLASFTTLGYGDVLAPIDWRILAALSGAHGMISFGLATAFLIEFILRMRIEKAA